MPKESNQAVKPPADDLDISWYSKSAEDVLSELQTQFHEGLSSDEAAQRLEKVGPNQLVEAPRPTFMQLVLNQFKDFIIILLIVAAVISALLGEYIDAGAIMLIVILNVVLAVIQESRAEQALAALKKMAAPEVQVMRDGHRVSIPTHDLVPGDIVFLEAGYYVPADIRLIEAINLKVEEAALTGESMPVEKNAAVTLDKDIPIGDRRNTAFMGTVVSYGRGRGVVTSTGMTTQLGLIATMLQSVEEEETPLQKRLAQLGKLLGYAALAVCALVFLVGFIRALVKIS